MKNIVFRDESVKRQITDSISENLTDTDLESSAVCCCLSLACLMWCESDCLFIQK